MSKSSKDGRTMRFLREIIALWPKRTDAEWAAHDARIREARAKEARWERIERWPQIRAALVEQGLSPRHLDNIAHGDTQDTPAVKAMRANAHRGVCVLAGNVGCGKTYAAHLWLLEAEKRHPHEWQPQQARMITSTWFARQSRYDGDGKFADISTVKRLVIDDMGVEYADTRGSFLVDLDELLDLRWRACLQTVITTNFSSEAFKERYGHRISDRIRHEGKYVVVKHPSLRGGQTSLPH